LAGHPAVSGWFNEIAAGAVAKHHDFFLDIVF